ncbi:hotdog fold thioesterase [Sphingorhabdus sp. Alg231-15]|uniref:hotdog fold thioesterase n=1 Tax=Sphingorhabdus sp. Alg231-15 TaxID=1922222 RepID=UPI000D550EC8
MIKEGFQPHFRKSPLTDPWEPLYSLVTNDATIIGFVSDNQHCNSRGFVHGGLISAIADNAMGLSCAMQHGEVSGLVTLNLHLDFARAAWKGEWLEFVTDVTKIGKSIDIAQGQVYSDGKLCALMTGTFSVRGSP